MSHKKVFCALLFVTNTFTSNAAYAQFGEDGEGFLLPMCQSFAQGTPEAQQFLQQLSEEERPLWLNKQNINLMRCNELVPKPIIQACTTWLGLIHRQADGAFPQDAFRKAFDEPTHNLLDNSAMQPYHQCLDSPF